MPIVAYIYLNAISILSQLEW